MLSKYRLLLLASSSEAAAYSQYNTEKKAKSVGCKIEDMRSRLCFLYPGIPGCLRMLVEILIDFEQ